MSRSRPLLPVTLSEADGVRYLHLGTPWIQGAMRVRQPQKLELEYIQRMLAALLWLPSAQIGQGLAVQLGMGAAALTRFTLKTLRMYTTVVEVHPMVIDVCRLWFGLPVGDRRLTVEHADAGDWLMSAEPGSVQLLQVDLYDHDAAAPVLDDLAFYAACRSLLAEGGVMSVNLFGRDASFERSAQRIAAAFGTDQVWRLRATREGNTVVVAGRRVTVPDRETLTRRADFIEARFGKLGLPARKWLRMVQPYVPEDRTD